MLLLQGLRIVPKTLSISVFIVLIVSFSLWFGQVLGRLYLADLAQDPRRGSSLSSADLQETSSKRKVLKLEKRSYYTLQIGIFDERAPAFILAKTLAQKGYPVIVTGGKPYQVMLGFFEGQQGIEPLLNAISVDGHKGQVIKKEINDVAYKFNGNDEYAAQYVAPLIGRLSEALGDALKLLGHQETQLFVTQDSTGLLALAKELESLANAGEKLDETKIKGIEEQAIVLFAQCREWAVSLRVLATTPSAYQVLLCQQQALAMIENYHRLLNRTN